MFRRTLGGGGGRAKEGERQDTASLEVVGDSEKRPRCFAKPLGLALTLRTSYTGLATLSERKSSRETVSYQAPESIP